MRTLEKLLQNIAAIVSAYEEQQEKKFRRGECFNVFNVLGMATKETRHSAFLAEMLNPSGSHGQKDKFLRLFCDTFLPNEIQINSMTKVEREHYIG